MSDSIPFYKTKRFWGLVIAAVGALLQGGDVWQILQSPDWQEVVTGAGGALAIYGAARARGPWSLA